MPFLAKKIVFTVLWLGGYLITSPIGYAASASGSRTYIHGIYSPVYPTPDYGTGQHADIIKRGEYLAKVSDCIACHTDVKNNQPAFAGGLGIKTPFGTFYSPNITPDKETGIGKWSDDDFVRALREGIAPNGSNYFPVFPYQYFNRMNRDDILAIKAYLFSIPAINKPNRENDVPFPFKVRFLQWGWKLLFFYFGSGEFKYNPEQSAAWNRGAYLVEGGGHCGMCHTPRNFLGGEKKAYALAGGFVDGYYAPDITQIGLGHTSAETVMRVFTHEKMIRGGDVKGPMEEVVHDSLQYLTEGDLLSMALYLQQVKSKQPEVNASTGPVSAETGKKIYEAKCTVCHGTGAAGAPKLGDVADWEVRLKQGLPTLQTRAIQGIGSMPPKGTCMDCSDAEIDAAVVYMVEQSKPGAKVATQTKAPAQVKLTLEDGKKIYENVCSVCHAEGKLGAPKVGDQTVWMPLLDQDTELLFEHAIKGYRRMPPKGTCVTCTDAEVMAATKYMMEESKTSGNYTLW